MTAKTLATRHAAVRDDIGDLITRRPVPGPTLDMLNLPRNDKGGIETDRALRVVDALKRLQCFVACGGVLGQARGEF